MNRHILFVTLTAAAVAACSDRGITGPRASLDAALAPAALSAVAPTAANTPGAVYALTNQAAGNAVAVFHRAADGTLGWAGQIATGGTGTGAALGSQGAVALSHDGRRLFAVNAGSNDVSVFTVGGAGLSLAGRTSSGGTLPISLTVHGDVLYVLNAGGSGNISGFTITRADTLAPIPGSTRPLSGANVGPAQVSFSPDGRHLVVTEKSTNLLDVYAVDADGVPSGPTTAASAGGTPFGFAFGLHDELFVSEAAGSASSYVLDASGTVSLVSGAVSTHRGAPCWAVVTNDGRFGYTGNGSGSVSAFAIAPNGAARLVDADGGTAIVTSGVNDIALSNNSRYLYVLGTGTAPAIHAFRVQADGHLTALGPIAGLPAGTRGLAAR